MVGLSFSKTGALPIHPPICPETLLGWWQVLHEFWVTRSPEGCMASYEFSASGCSLKGTFVFPGLILMLAPTHCWPYSMGADDSHGPVWI